MSLSAILRAFFFTSAMLTLAACQSEEERAEAHYQSALALMEEGDTVRAALEFRNVFDLDGMHLEARETYAAMLRREGDIQQSYRQYLRLVEQDPDNFEGRIALAEMALETQSWEEARRHGARAIEMVPERPEVAIIAANLDYIDAVEAGDEPARRTAYDRAAELLRDNPDNPVLLRLAADSLLRDGEREDALAVLNRAMAVDRDNRQFYDLRMQLLVELDRLPELETLLREMIETFPGDETLPAMLLRLYIAQGNTGAAQDFLRAYAETAATEERRRDALMGLVQILLETDGTEAAMTELDAIIAAEQGSGQEAGQGGAMTFRTLRAGMRFDAGERAAAIADLRALLEEGLSPAEAGQIRVALARMLLVQGDPAEARQLIETTLEQDSGQVEALKMLAAWLIEEDRTDQAIARLRTALDSAPEDADALSLMAEAHTRNGDRQLAREFLALAAEASGSAPAETLRYAAALLQDQRYALAEEALIASLRLTPGDPELLAVLGQIYTRLENWARAEQVERTLREVGTPEALGIADNLRTAILAARGRTDEAIAFLEDLAAAGGPGDVAAQIAVVRARLATGDAAGALSFAEGLVADDPDNRTLRFMLAAVQGATGDHAAAEAIYRALLEEDAAIPQAWIGLMRSLTAQGDTAAAEAALEEALQVLPEAPDLLWALASQRERQGDFEGAIEIYERLYAVLPNAPVVANNLASLISTYREDTESLERAYAIARRLRGVEVPPFQDTYGWIAYRRGDYQEALAHLEPAAAALSGDALVQFHLGMTFLALDRQDRALEQLRLAVDLAGPDDPRPQFDRAREEIARLEATAEAGERAAHAAGRD